MRLLLRLFLFFIVAVPLALAVALLLAVDNHPAVDRSAEFTPESIERIKQVLQKNDPRNLKRGAPRAVSVSQAELDLAVNYLVHRYGYGSARVALKDGALSIAMSAELPNNPIGRFVNVDATLAETETLPRFEHLRIGRLPAPAWLVNRLVAHLLARLERGGDYGSFTGVVKQVSFAGGRLHVIYNWRPDVPGKALSVLLRNQDLNLLRVYQEGLSQVSRTTRAGIFPLADLMRPLFKLAQERSRAGDPAAENRAAIFVLAFYVAYTDLAAAVPANDWPQAAMHDVTLNGRVDFSQHFMISAALAANAGGRVSDALGLYKEVTDSRGGSGFSFNDIAADRAGTRFGELAVGDPASAAKLQQRLSAGMRESDLFPATADLPEFMPEEEFKRRFGGIGAPPYKQLMAEIERRVAGLALYR